MMIFQEKRNFFLIHFFSSPVSKFSTLFFFFFLFLLVCSKKKTLFSHAFYFKHKHKKYYSFFSIYPKHCHILENFPSFIFRLSLNLSFFSGLEFFFSHQFLLCAPNSEEKKMIMVVIFFSVQFSRNFH